MTKEEATKLLKEKQRKQCNMFCPIIVNKCRSDCMCYRSGAVLTTTYADNNIDYTINSPYCSMINEI